MTRAARRQIVVLGAVALAAMLAACGSGGSANTSGTPITAASKTTAKPLQFRAVESETQGSCPSRSAATVEDHGSCLHLGEPAMSVRSVKSAEVTSEPQWSVIVVLGPDDARSLQRLTTTVSKRQGPRNRVAMLLGAGSDHRLLSAPSVMQPIVGGSVQLTGGFTEKEAEQLAHNLTAS